MCLNLYNKVLECVGLWHKFVYNQKFILHKIFCTSLPINVHWSWVSMEHQIPPPGYTSVSIGAGILWYDLWTDHSWGHWTQRPASTQWNTVMGRLQWTFEREPEVVSSKTGLSHHFIFQYNSDAQHTSLLVNNYLHKTKVSVTDKPDLNPTENMWSDIEKNKCLCQKTFNSGEIWEICQRRMGWDSSVEEPDLWKLQQTTAGSYPARRRHNPLLECGRLIILTLVIIFICEQNNKTVSNQSKNLALLKIYCSKPLGKRVDLIITPKFTMVWKAVTDASWPQVCLTSPLPPLCITLTSVNDLL